MVHRATKVLGPSFLRQFGRTEPILQQRLYQVAELPPRFFHEQPMRHPCVGIAPNAETRQGCGAEAGRRLKILALAPSVWQGRVPKNEDSLSNRKHHLFGFNASYLDGKGIISTCQNVW